MRKYITAFFLIALLFVAACSNGQQESNTTESEDSTADNGTTTETTTDGTGPITSMDNPCIEFNLVDDVLLSEPMDNVPEVNDGDLIYGSEDAKYTFIVYSNFTCSHCATLEPILEALVELYPQDVSVVFRYVTTGGISNWSAQAVEAAKNQGKFNEMKAVILANQQTWWNFTEQEFRSWLDKRAEEFDMDIAQFNADMDADETLDKVAFNRTQVSELGIAGTPTLYVNNRQYSPYQDRSIFTLATMVNVLNISGDMLNACPTIDTEYSADLQAVLSTDDGDIVIDLYEDQAPYTVGFFKYLADQGWYDNTDVFVSTEELVMAGDPSNSLYGGPGFIFLDEAEEVSPLEEEGLLVSFNRLGPGYNSGTFFITKGAVAEFGGTYTVIGKVIEGLDLVKAMDLREYSIDPTIPFSNQINSITITEQ